MPTATDTLLTVVQMEGIENWMGGQRRMERGMEDMVRRQQQMRQSAEQLGRTMLVAGGAITGAYGMAIRQGMAFQAGMAEVGTLVDKTTVSMSDLSRGVRDLALESGESTAVLTKGLYQAISAGIPAGEALAFLGVASQRPLAASAIRRLPWTVLPRCSPPGAGGRAMPRKSPTVCSRR